MTHITRLDSLQNQLTERNDGDTEWRKAIKHILEILHEIWIVRNNQLHGNNQTALERRKTTIIKPTMT
jgi:hypothetical protein